MFGPFVRSFPFWAESAEVQIVGHEACPEFPINESPALRYIARLEVAVKVRELVPGSWFPGLHYVRPRIARCETSFCHPLDGFQWV
eukprot:11217203-Lingulodinium_polyedra.AAC.1